MTDLLPCPFCGGMLFAFSEDERQIRCASCNACGPELIMVCSDTPEGLRRAVVEAAVEAWNRRAAYAAVINNTLHTVTVQQETPAPDTHSYSEDEEA